MYLTRSWVLGEAPRSTFHETISPKPTGVVPLGPCMVVRMPVFLANQVGSSLHCSQVGSASSRNPASSSSKKDDQIVIAASPAKYVARVVSASWLPGTDAVLISWRKSRTLPDTAGWSR